MTNRALVRVYQLTAALLVTHEIDSAYWKEWELFRLPGGLAGFLVLHVPLILIVLWGHEQVVLSKVVGAWISIALAASGITALVLHGGFLIAGRPEFRTPASLALLTAIGAVSVLLTAVAVAELRRGAIRERV